MCKIRLLKCGFTLFQQQQCLAFQEVMTFLFPFKPLKIKIYLFLTYMRNMSYYLTEIKSVLPLEIPVIEWYIGKQVLSNARYLRKT